MRRCDGGRGTIHRVFPLLLILVAFANCRINGFTIPLPVVTGKSNHLSPSVLSVMSKKNDHSDDDEAPNQPLFNRRKALQKASTLSTLLTLTQAPPPAHAAITPSSQWPLWPALPVAPYSRRRTIRYDIVPDQVWAFDQLIGIYYVHVPIRMTVVRRSDGGLLVYAPVAPTQECLALVQDLIDRYGPVKDIILPSVAVEHKVNAGPFARVFPNANFYVTDRQYAFPLNLPGSFLGFPSWTQPLPSSSHPQDGTSVDSIDWGGTDSDLRHEVITVKPGIGSMYQDLALLHVPSKTLLICDAVFGVDGTPPRILTEEEEYTRALFFHARESKDDVVVEDTPETRKKGWRRIVLLFNFFFPGSGRGYLGPRRIGGALSTPFYPAPPFLPPFPDTRPLPLPPSSISLPNALPLRYGAATGTRAKFENLGLRKRIFSLAISGW